ncbi:MAG: ribonuclease III [Flavobacteriales bacterium]
MKLRKLFKRSTGAKDERVVKYVRKQFGFTPSDTDVYLLAFRHSSAATKDASGFKNSNERLEYLGDAILDSIVAHHLYNRFPTLPEGDLTKMKSKIVSRKNLNAIGRSINLPDQLELRLGKQPLHQSIVGNAFEALVGAIYLDQGYDTTERHILKVLKKNGLNKRVHIDVDFKSKLHEWCQKNRRKLRFQVVREVQDSGRSLYEVEVFIDGKSYGTGTGKSKKAAEQASAKHACARLFRD